MTHHGVLMAVQPGMELGKGALEVGESRPDGPGRAEVGEHVFRENAVEQVPLLSIKREAIKVEQFNDRCFVMLNHACAPWSFLV